MSIYVCIYSLTPSCQLTGKEKAGLWGCRWAIDGRWLGGAAGGDRPLLAGGRIAAGREDRTGERESEQGTTRGVRAATCEGRWRPVVLGGACFASAGHCCRLLGGMGERRRRTGEGRARDRERWSGVLVRDKEGCYTIYIYITWNYGVVLFPIPLSHANAPPYAIHPLFPAIEFQPLSLYLTWLIFIT